ncbi:MAG: hypothetical protein ACK5Q3_14925 [Planctomycetota bacterium]|jgi:hypothetical protein
MKVSETEIKCAHADQDKQQGRRSDLLDDDNKSRLGNRGRAYWLRRLAREHRELFEQVAAGDLSVHAACVRAGIRGKKPRLKWLLDNWLDFSPEDRSEFIKRILLRR